MKLSGTALGGGGGKPLNFYNFPLTIGPEQPEPVAEGHLWVKLDADKAAQITHVYLDDTVRLTHEDGSLIINVADMGSIYEQIQHQKKTTDGQPISFEMLHSFTSPPIWRASFIDLPKLHLEIKLNISAVFLRAGGTTKAVNAYRWSGSGWIQASFEDSFLALPLWDGNTSTYAAYAGIFVKRANTFEKLIYLSHGNINAMTCAFSGDGLTFISASADNTVKIYRVVGQEFVLIQTLTVSGTGNYMYASLYVSQDGNYFARVCLNGKIYVYKRAGNTYTLLRELINGVTSSISGVGWATFSTDFSHFVFATINSDARITLSLYRFHEDQDTLLHTFVPTTSLQYNYGFSIFANYSLNKFVTIGSPGSSSEGASYFLHTFYVRNEKIVEASNEVDIGSAYRRNRTTAASSDLKYLKIADWIFKEKDSGYELMQTISLNESMSSFSSDGEYLAISVSGGKCHLYALNADKTQYIKITELPYDAYQPFSNSNSDWAKYNLFFPT